MEREEKIRRLAERMKVTPEEAAKALDEAGGDLLDAALLLERGRRAEEQVVHSHSTAAAAAQLPAATAAPAEEDGPSAGELAKTIAVAVLTGLVTHPILNGVEVSQNGKRLTVIPGVILLLLLVVRWWIAPALFTVGLFAGWHFAWSGPQWSCPQLNAAWGKLEDAADRFRTDMKNAHKGRS